MKCWIFLFVPAIICQVIIGTVVIRHRPGQDASLNPYTPSKIKADENQSHESLEINHEGCEGNCGSGAENPLSPNTNLGQEIENSKEHMSKTFTTGNLKDTTALSSTRTISNNERIESCMQSCPVTTEYKPTCSSDIVTYRNPGHLICLIKCGISVDLSKLLPCELEQITTEKTLSKEKQIAICIKTCPVNGKYIPVCGSDNVTYANLGHLECAKNCGALVHLSRQTACTATLANKEPPNDRLTTRSTEQSNLITTTISTALPFVNRNETLTEENNYYLNNNEHPGNYSTVANSFNQIVNVNNNNVSNAFQSNGSAVYKGDRENINKETAVELYITDASYLNNNNDEKEKFFSRGNQSTNSHDDVNTEYLDDKKVHCTQLCTLSSEYNPVCGSNGITYTNPGRLLCAQYCGDDVRLVKFAPCLSEGTTSTPHVSQLSTCLTTFTNPPVTDNSVTISPTDSCIESCPASLVYKPVCGSNNVTYRNKEVLQCARRCEVDVTLETESECTVKPSTEPPESSNHEIKRAKIQKCVNWCFATRYPQNYEPLCGSDDVTYNNTGHLICAIQCGIDVYIKKRAACNDTTDKGIVTTLGLPSALGLNTDKDQISAKSNTSTMATASTPKKTTSSTTSNITMTTSTPTITTSSATSKITVATADPSPEINISTTRKITTTTTTTTRVVRTPARDNKVDGFLTSIKKAIGGFKRFLLNP